MINGRDILALTAAAGGLLLLATRGVAVPGQALNIDQVRSLAERTINKYGFDGMDPRWPVAVAWIESAFNPTAVRVEPRIGDASVGLMQTLVGTARDMSRSFQDKGVPDFSALLDPETSMYFGIAYLFWLKGRDAFDRHGEEFAIRAYNGGPGGWSRSATQPYWDRYRAARERFG